MGSQVSETRLQRSVDDVNLLDNQQNEGTKETVNNPELRAYIKHDSLH